MIGRLEGRLAGDLGGRVARRLAAAIVAAALALGSMSLGTTAASARPASAAAGDVTAGPSALAASTGTPALTLVTQAAYAVEPASGKVAVSVGITATNHLRNTVTKTYYFRTAYLAVLPDTTNFRLTATGARPSVAVSKRTSTYTLLRLDFGANLAAGKTRVMTLTFDLEDPGGAPDRPIRISSTLVSFYAWAYGTPSTPGSTVSVTFPSGYDVTVGRGPLNGPTTDGSGNQTWTSASIADALSFVADLTADHPSSYVESTDAVTIGGSQAQLVLRSWPDDSAWRDRVSKLLGEGLPVLASDLGLPWPPDQSPLIVQEALVRTTGGYAGLFDPSKHLIEIAYAAPTGVVLHEAAHAWLNGQLLADRWAAEAFASYYASVAAGQLQVRISSPVMTPQEQAAAIPLNAWGAVGTEPAETEAYAYAASLTLAQAIAARAGADGLRKVWAQAAAGEGAYQPPNAPPETGAAPPDWRGLLDLLEDDTSASYVDLWRTWVVRPEDVDALNEREVARASYEQALADASPWALPASIRSAMRAWSFADAERELADAETVIGQRAAVQREAAAAGLQLPATLQHDFESGNLADATTEASVELTTVQAIEAATSSRIAQPDPIEAVGLLGTSPDTDLSTARNALAAGDLAGAVNAAAIARTDWTSAENVGRGRLVGAALLAAALVLFAGLLWGRRRRRPVTATGPETTPMDPGDAPDEPTSGPPRSDDPAAPASATPGPAR